MNSKLLSQISDKAPHRQLGKFLLAATAFLALQPTLAAPVAITGPIEYTQDFNVLATTTNRTTSTTPWADDATVPGWFLMRAGATNAGLVGAAYTYRVSDGQSGLANAGGLADTGHFYSMGALGNVDRGLGAVPISAQGEFSVVAVFQNTGTTAVKLDQLAYRAEVWRTNQNANTTESLFVSYRKGVSQAAVLALTTATANATVFPPAVATGPGSLYQTGWSRWAGADYVYQESAANTQVEIGTPITAAPPAEIRLEPGEFLALRWANINDAGADAIMGLDDVKATFVSAVGGITTVTENIVRSDAGTTRMPGDDSVSFHLNVTGDGPVGPRWRIKAPAALAGVTGAYGVSVPIPAQGISAFDAVTHALVIQLEDETTPTITGSVAVVAPWCRISVGTAGNFEYDDNQTSTPTDDVVTFIMSVDGTYTGENFTGNGTDFIPYGGLVRVVRAAPGTFSDILLTDQADPTCQARTQVFPPAIIGVNATVTPTLALLSRPIGVDGGVRWTAAPATGQVVQSGNPTQQEHVLESLPLDLTNVGEVTFTARLNAISGASSGFELTDYFGLELVVDGVARSVLGATDTDGDGKLLGTIELQAGANLNTPFDFQDIIPATANSVFLRIIGNSNSTNETLSLSAIQFAMPQPQVSLTPATNIIRLPNGPGLADDTVQFDTTTTGSNGGDGWVLSAGVTATPTAGGFGPVTFTVPAGASSFVLRVQDNTVAVATVSITVPLPGPFVLGSTRFNSVPGQLGTDPLVASTGTWTLNPATRTLRMVNAVTEGVVMSEVLSLQAFTGEVRFSAKLNVQDLSGGFETTDTFLMQLILDGNTAQPINLTTAYDADASGQMNGGELCPPPPVAPATQSFDYAFSHTIPDGTLTVQLVIRGLNNSANEIMTVSDIFFASVDPDSDGDGMSDPWEELYLFQKGDPTDGPLDADGDGASNAAEFLAGTNPILASSRLRAVSVNLANPVTGAGTISWESVPGRRYQIQTSTAPGLFWQDVGGVQLGGAGATTTAPLTLPVVPQGFGFARIKALGE